MHPGLVPANCLCDGERPRSIRQLCSESVRVLERRIRTVSAERGHRVNRVADERDPARRGRLEWRRRPNRHQDGIMRIRISNQYLEIIVKTLDDAPCDLTERCRTKLANVRTIVFATGPRPNEIVVSRPAPSSDP